MQDHQQQARRIPVGIIAGIAAVVVTAGGGTAWWTWNTLHSSSDVSNPDVTTPTTPDAIEPSPSQPAAPSIETTAQIYWLDVAGTRFELVPAPVQLQQAGEPGDVLTTAFETLLNGPSESPTFSAIPDGTELLNLSVESDGVHVNLSDSFTVGGGSASMMGRLGQVIYTATSLEPNSRVWISVEGEPLEVLGGEGLIVDQPITREGFEENFPL
ncbi:MAG TPA: GerMN domain-containing protein [Elainellaceae cyanobacterium]